MLRRRRKVFADEDRSVKDVERARERTMNRAVKLLAAKPRSIRELRDRLLEKQWTNVEIVDSVIGKLAEYDYVDDDRFAADLAMSKLRQRPQGERRLRNTLSQKKLDKETVDRAIEQAFGSLPESELIDRAIEKRVRLKGRPRTRDEKRRFYDHLLRQGFGYDLIIGKMKDITKLDEADADAHA